MNTINDNSLFNDLGLIRQESQSAPSNDTLDQADFLALLTTQLANQDPFEPMDNKEFIAQMAQFSQLEGVNDLTSGFNSLASSLTSNQALQASALVGRSVMVPTGVGYLDESGSIEGRVSLPTSTQNVWMEVKSENGQVIKRIELGDYSAGDLEFEWDGLNEEGERMPEGAYSISVYGQVGNVTEQLGTAIRAEVSSVNLGSANGDILLNLRGLGQAFLSDVDEIGQ